MIRTMMNGAVHFAGGVAFGVLTLFAAKGAADLLMSGDRRDFDRLDGLKGSSRPTGEEKLREGDGI